MAVVIGLDLESTGRDTKEDRIIEVAAVVYNTEEKAPLEIFSSLIRLSELPPSDYTSPTGIKGAWLLKYGISFPDCMGEVQRMIAKADPVALVAFNGNSFDRPLLKAELKRHNIIAHAVDELHLIDPRFDLPLKYQPKSTALTYMAADHGFINYFPHRALFDVMTMLKILDHYNFEEVLALSRVPWVTLKACVGYDDRQLAKDLGYSWEKIMETTYPKTWVKRIRETEMEKEELAAKGKGFRIIKCG